MRILMTGAEGFVAHHLVRQLLDHGHEVVGTYLNPIPKPPIHNAFDSVQVDLTDRATVAQLMSDPFDRVVHLAGRSHVGSSWSMPAEYFEANVLATEYLLDELPDGCSMVFSSSAEVYGLVPEAELPIVEERPLRPNNPYALTKAAAERIALRAGAVVARNFNLIGAGQAETFALPGFARQLGAIARGEAEPVLSVGNLDARRDFVHVKDGARALCILTENGIFGQPYNVASGRAHSIRDLLDMLCSASKLDVAVETDPDRLRPLDNPVTCGSAEKLRALGWQPELTIEDAILELWQSVTGAAD